MNTQKGSAHLFIIIGLVLLLLGALGFIFWQNFINRDDSSTKTTTSLPAKNSVKEVVELPDMITYDPAIQITNSKDTAALKDAPDSFKEFINKSIADEKKAFDSEPQEGCFPVYTVNKIYKQRYAVGGVSAGGGCAGGAAVLWGEIDGNWKKISGTQNIGFACADLELYKVPSAIADTTCFDPSSSDGSRSYLQE